MTPARSPRRAALAEFVRAETTGAWVLLAAVAAALVWANSPWSESYASFWSTTRQLEVAGRSFSFDLHEVVNEGLMTIFFLVVGLEIKRELTTGELDTIRKAALPAIAALGGMVVPALVYLAVAGGGEAAGGWAIPTATDIALVVGLLALAARAAPRGLRAFVLSLAIADDIGAVLVIALFSSTSIEPAWTAGAIVAAVVVAALGRMERVPVPVLAVAGAVMWWCALRSGIHPALAGVAFALLVPSGRLASLESALHPVSSMVAVPLFGLANAGLSLAGDVPAHDAGGRVIAGIIAGLVVGKPLGIAGASWLATRLGWAHLPEGVSLPLIAGAGAMAGIGFTVSLFVAELAFDDAALVNDARAGILVASALAAIVGAVVLRRLVRDRGP